MRRRRAALIIVIVTLVILLVAAHGRTAPSEFAGDGWYQGRVLVCKHAGDCSQLRYPLPQHQTVYVELRVASNGRLTSGLAVDNDGTFGSWTTPGTYDATLKPNRLYGLLADTVRVTTTANGRIAFALSYGRASR
jgi:hypothetical protein